MGWLPALSISRKLMLIIMITSTVTLLAATAAFMYADRNATRERLVYLVTSQADLVGAGSTAALAFRDSIAAAETLNSLSGQDHILEAVIFDRNGEEFAAYSNAVAEQSRRMKPSDTNVNFEGDSLQLIQPVFFQDEQVGSIMLVADVNRLHSRLGDITSIIIIVLLGTLAAALLISMGIQRTISVPVRELASVAERVSREQDYSIRARKLTDDELGGLVNGMNEMLSQIQKRDQMLARHAGTLEKKVEERTRELHELTEKFRHRAYHDELTKLPNRALFENRLSHALEVGRRNNNRVTVMFLDLDRFKMINDTLGHATGDKLLGHIADTLTACLRKEDTVARLGGDEFTVLIESIESVEQAGRMARKIINKVQEPVVLDGRELRVSTSIGISIFPDDAQDTASLMRCADAALYLSKEGGRNQHHFYTDSLHQAAMRRMRLENELFQAIEEGHLSLNYLPRHSLADNQVTGIETLLRWDHQEFGQILPDEFVQVAEDAGLMTELGEWVLGHAIQQLRRWDDSGIQVPCLSLNISAHQLVKPDLLVHVSNVLEQYEIRPERIEFEFGEKALDLNSRQTEMNLRQLSDLGIRLTIDNFGRETGNLNQLRRLPVDVVKIPRDFIHHVSDEDERSVIIKAIVLLAHGLGIKVVAKGVESKPELDCLIKAGCDEAQGFLLNRPVAAEKVPDLLRAVGPD